MFFCIFVVYMSEIEYFNGFKITDIKLYESYFLNNFEIENSYLYMTYTYSGGILKSESYEILDIELDNNIGGIVKNVFFKVKEIGAYTSTSLIIENKDSIKQVYEKLIAHYKYNKRKKIIESL